MSNPAFMSVCFEGEKRELRSLYGKMKRLQERKEPLVENSFYYPKQWLGNLVVRLGKDWREVFCRGTWSSLKLYSDHLYFFTETAWNPPIELLELIRQRYPSLKYYYSAEGDEDLQFTNDVEGRYFTARYIVDAEPDMDYFDTIEEACQHLQVCIGRPVEPTWDGLCKAAEDWNDDNPDADWQINIKRFEVVTDEEIVDSAK